MNTAETEVPMLTVSRFLGLLRAINVNGPMTVGQMVQATGMPYPTTSRMVNTMLWHQLVERVPHSNRYRAAALTLSLSSGFQLPNRLAAAARPTIEALTERIGWPVAILTRVGTSMVTRASTHHLTSLTFGPCPDGSTVPVEHSASGHVYLAHASQPERRGVFDGLQRFGVRTPMMSMLVQGRALDLIRANGYATYERNTYVAHPGKTSSISVPIHHDGALQGAMTVVFFSSAMSMKEALRRYLGELQAAAGVIGNALGAAASFAAPAQAHERIGTPNAVRVTSRTARPPTFTPSRRTASGRDAASAFSNLITDELRQGKSSKQPGAPRPS